MAPLFSLASVPPNPKPTTDYNLMLMSKILQSMRILCPGEKNPRMYLSKLLKKLLKDIFEKFR